MIKAFLFLVPYSLPYFFAGLSWLGMRAGGLACFSGLLLFFVIHPVLDNVFFALLRIPPVANDLKTNPLLRRVMLLPLLGAVPLMSALLWDLLSHRIAGASSFELTGMILTTGTLMGVLGINVAHELVHRREAGLRACGVYLLALCNFSHWGIAHVFSHHKNVGTPLDSATARKNEWVYHFWFRAYAGGLHEAWQVEQKRLKSFSLAGLFRHRIYIYFFIKLALAFGVFFFFGPRGLIFWWGQSLVAILLLETVDYIEHYALQRKKNPESSLYEAFRAEHAWDSYRALTNGALMKLGYHSHHHLKASLPYTDLQVSPHSRELPLGYSGMALLALCPPLFMKMMNARLQFPPEALDQPGQDLK